MTQEYAKLRRNKSVMTKGIAHVFRNEALITKGIESRYADDYHTKLERAVETIGEDPRSVAVIKSFVREKGLKKARTEIAGFVKDASDPGAEDAEGLAQAIIDAVTNTDSVDNFKLRFSPGQRPGIASADGRPRTTGWHNQNQQSRSDNAFVSGGSDKKTPDAYGAGFRSATQPGSGYPEEAGRERQGDQSRTGTGDDVARTRTSYHSPDAAVRGERNPDLDVHRGSGRSGNYGKPSYITTDTSRGDRVVRKSNGVEVRTTDHSSFVGPGIFKSKRSEAEWKLMLGRMYERNKRSIGDPGREGNTRGLSWEQVAKEVEAETKLDEDETGTIGRPTGFREEETDEEIAQLREELRRRGYREEDFITMGPTGSIPSRSEEDEDDYNEAKKIEDRITALRKAKATMRLLK